MHISRWDRWQYAGKNIDRGQIVEMAGALNDEKLLRLGYVIEVTEKSPRLLECGECGAKFLEDAARLAHGRRWHPHREHKPEITPSAVYNPMTGEPSAWVDTEGDRDDRRREQDTPLYLDKTIASRS